jgi:hypothetical protein
MAYFDDASDDDQQEGKGESHLNEALPPRRFEGLKALMDEIGQSLDFHCKTPYDWISTTAPVTALMGTV